MKLDKKKILTYLATVALALVLTVTAVFGYAYFSKKEIYDGYLSGQVELLFDRLDDTGLAAYGTAEGVAANKEATWGTKENPYVISNVRHLYNLSELQNIGYFYKQFISLNTPEDYSHMPYFLVCEPDYTPVLIDGSTFGDITAIGSDEYPFIGSVKGVHIETADADGNPINRDQMIQVSDNNSATSVIHNVSVKGNPGVVDAGLFGYVSFLGTPPDENSGDTTFLGMPSTLSNLVLSDVTVSLKSTLWDKVTEFVKDIALGEGGHRYSFTELYGVTDANGNPLNIYDTVPHENHHIGILAGHVSYSIVEYISVYYSNDDIVAIDLSDANEVGGVKANYMSATGIIGFIYNLNPAFNEETGTLTAGSGDSVSDLSYSMVGGGGDKVGDKAGYILAKNIFDKYNYIANSQDGTLTPNNEDTIKISTATTADGTQLCYQSVRDMGILGTQTGYYFYDGVFTFALSSDNDVIEPTWDGEIDEFYIGSTNRNDWVNTYTEDKLAVAAYLSPITSDLQLQLASDAGKPIVILKDLDTSAFLMSLSEWSGSATASFATSFNNSFTTKGNHIDYATRDNNGLITTLLNGFNDPNKDADYYNSTFKKYAESNMTADEIEAIMNEIQNVNTDWKVINVGSFKDDSSGSDNESLLNTLKSKYKIVSGHIDGQYSYFIGDTPLTINSDNTVADYYDYFKETEYTGYMYYTTEWRLLYTNYTYFWQDENGGIHEITTVRNGEPDNYTTDLNWRGEQIYSITANGTTYTGAMVNLSDSEFLSGTSAIISGPVLLIPTNNRSQYFYKSIDENVYRHCSNSNVTFNPDVFSNATSTGISDSGSPIYTVTQNGITYSGVLVDRYYNYTFSNTSDLQSGNVLRLIQANFGLLGNHDAIWNGSNADLSNYNNFKFNWILGTATASSVTSNSGATVKFDANGNCYLNYTLGNVSKYVGYRTSNPAYSGASLRDESTKLRMYVLEATQNINFGNVTFSPEEITTDNTFKANEHLLYATTDANGNTFYEVMDVTKLPNLGNPDSLGWRSGNAADGENGVLSGKDLTKKFHTEKGIQFGAVLNIGGFQLGTNGMITAPVGPLGTYADVPLGCVAFRINKEGTQHIRVIISVSVSEFYVGEESGFGEENTLGNSRRYFNMWQINESGSETINLFIKNQAVERFEIPISHPYAPDATPQTSAQGFYTVQYDSNGDGAAEDYGLYMNGDRILLAYEFTVNEVGLYILGPSGFNLDSGGFMQNFEGPDVPMEIVYFSADGVASAGRDGASASQIGTIDYVYDYGGEIITVTDTSETESDGTEDYSTYYPSYCLTYFETTKKIDDKFVSVNNERVKIRRYVADSPPTSSEGYNQTNSLSAIHYTIGGDRYANIVQYSRYCDNVIKDEE